MRALLALALLAGACKDHPSASPHMAKPYDETACADALVKARFAPARERTKLVLDGCRVCGDWDPILRWNTPQTSGGPKRTDIEAAMVRCKAFCTGDAKLKFLGTLDDARGTSSRTPWRQLAEICKDKVSAVPDGRFMGATYFALDRIARVVEGEIPKGKVQRITSAIDLVLPLPPTTVVGTNITLPVVDSGANAPQDPLDVLTYIAGDVYFDDLPSARLASTGVRVSNGAASYPGRKVTVAELPSVLGDDQHRRHDVLNQGGPEYMQELSPLPILLVALPAARASDLIPIIAAAAPFGPVQLAATTATEDATWPVLAGMQVTLDVKDPTIKLGPDTTVQQLAEILQKQAASGATRIGLAAQ